MDKPIIILCLFLITSSISACAELPAQTGNTPDQQRSNARDAQGELATDAQKVPR